MTAAGGPRRLALAAGVAAALAAAAAAAQAPAPMQPYADRIIAPDRLAPLPADEDDEADYDAQGLPRSLWVKLDASRSDDDASDRREGGVSAGGFWETAGHGSFSLDASVFDRGDGLDGRTGERTGSATLWQRNLHLPGGWRADHGVGVLNTPSLPLQRNQYRFFLPTTPLAGAAGDWLQAGSGLRLQAAYGRAGSYTGSRLVGFDVADGHVATFGLQADWDPRWSSALSFLATRGRIVPDGFGGGVFDPRDAQAVHAATQWRGDADEVQFNLLSSDGDDGRAEGAWIDATARRGRFVHHYGAFRLDPGLAWGALPINQDAQGAYYRAAYQYGRWLWNAGVDVVGSPSGAGFDGAYATGYLRYQASTTVGYGGSASVRDADARAWAAQLFVDRAGAWGTTRVQFDQADSAGRRSWQLGVDQAWPASEGNRLSTSIAHGELSYDGAAPTRTTLLAAYGGRALGDRVSLDGSVRWAYGDGPDAARTRDANVSLNWQVARGWTLAAAVFQSKGSRRSPFQLDPLVPDPGFVALPRDRSVFLTVRYERQAGRPQGVIGGAPGAAVGGVRGSVYLDDNGDGQRAASEQPAANVTVVLDGRYAVRTDAQGEFAFPRVATGTHRLTVVPDNLPLPWRLDGPAAERTVEVTVRDDARVDVGALRPR